MTVFILIDEEDIAFNRSYRRSTSWLSDHAKPTSAAAMCILENQFRMNNE
jgi:hypothetical protein